MEYGKTILIEVRAATIMAKIESIEMTVKIIGK
jgi:hypothetical protein